MGKRDFEEIYQDAARALGTRPTIKLSYYCNDYHPDGNFAGMIVYHTYGQHKWKQRPNQGLAGGYRGRSFYVLILCTDEWPDEVMQAAGQGRVHDYLYRRYFNMEYTAGKRCCAGFAVRQGNVSHSSVYLNDHNGFQRGMKWQSDGSKYLSRIEGDIVDLVIHEWKEIGPDRVINIPDWINDQAYE